MKTKIYLLKPKDIQLFYFLNLLCFTSIIYSCATRGENKKAEKSTSQALIADAVVLKEVNLENNVFTTGTLISNEFIELKAPIAGTIIKISIREGEKVNAGQKLVQLDDREWQAQLRRFQAQLSVAERNLERNQSLLEINGISQEIVDQAEGTVAVLKANVAEIQVKIDQASVEAPFDGFVGLRSISIGEFVTAGTSMASLVQSNPIKLDFSLPGKYASQLRPGQQVNFGVDGAPDTLIASIYAVEPRLDESSRTIRVRAKAKNNRGNLFPGAFVNVKITLDLIANTVVVPTESVIPELNVQKVFLIRDGKAVGQNVDLGIRSGKFVQITGGLEAGDTVLTTGLLQVQEGQPVKAGEIRWSDGMMDAESIRQE